jgi:hypothetical protein
MDQLAVGPYLAATERLTIRALAGEHNPPDVGKHCEIPQRGHLTVCAACAWVRFSTWNPRKARMAMVGHVLQHQGLASYHTK